MFEIVYGMKENHINSNIYIPDLLVETFHEMIKKSPYTFYELRSITPESLDKNIPGKLIARFEKGQRGWNFISNA